MKHSEHKVTALILAGTRQGSKDPMAVAAGVSHKAIIPVDGQPMILRVTDALRRSPAIGKIVVCIEAPEAIRALLPPDISIIPASSGPSASVSAALTHLGTPLLITTADHALLQPAWIETFLQESGNADLAVAVATRETIMRDVPNTRRTWIHLADMSFSGCNMFLFRTPAATGVAELWRTIERERKRPWKMAWLLSPRLLLHWLCGRLDSITLCRHIQSLTGAETCLVRMPDGRAAVDVDKPADLELTEFLLRKDLRDPAFSTMK